MKDCPGCNTIVSTEVMCSELFMANLLMPRDEDWLRRSTAASFGSNYGVRCPTCETRLNHTFDEYKGSVVLVVSHDFYDNPKAPKATANNIVPDTFLFGNTLYRLSGCGYTDGGHFVSIGRDVTTGKFFYCNGMRNNAQFTSKVCQTFPSTFKEDGDDYKLSFAFFIRADMMCV